MKLEELLNYVQPTEYIVTTENYSDRFETPVLTAGKTFVLGKTNEREGIYPASKQEPVILFDDFTTASQWVDFPFKVKSSACKILTPKKDVNLKYVYYAMKSIRFNASQHMRYWISKYSKKEIRYPDSHKQALIVESLDKITNEIKNEICLLSTLDSLIKSRFNEMFSNLDDYVTVQDSCEVHARIGWQALTQKEHMKTGKYMLITGTDFKDNEINYSSCVFVTKERYEMDRHIILRNDDVLITKDGTIGKVAIVHNLPGPATLNSGVFVLRPDNRFNKEYISYVFKGEPFSRFVEEVKTGVTVKHLNQANLLKFKIPVPKKKDQEHFALFLKIIDKLKFNCQQRIKLYQELLDKKMDEYFG